VATFAEVFAVLVMLLLRAAVVQEVYSIGHMVC